MLSNLYVLMVLSKRLGYLKPRIIDISCEPMFSYFKGKKEVCGKQKKTSRFQKRWNSTT